MPRILSGSKAGRPVRWRITHGSSKSVMLSPNSAISCYSPTIYTIPKPWLCWMMRRHFCLSKASLPNCYSHKWRLLARASPRQVVANLRSVLRQHLLSRACGLPVAWRKGLMRMHMLAHCQSVVAEPLRYWEPA